MVQAAIIIFLNYKIFSIYSSVNQHSNSPKTPVQQVGKCNLDIKHLLYGEKQNFQNNVLAK
jgi:hypothetical protein